jgi:hypothetical protein
MFRGVSIDNRKVVVLDIIHPSNIKRRTMEEHNINRRRDYNIFPYEDNETYSRDSLETHRQLLELLRKDALRVAETRTNQTFIIDNLNKNELKELKEIIQNHHQDNIKSVNIRNKTIFDFIDID